MASAAQSPIHVFISYSHKDEKWLERLRVHLKPLERKRAELDIWDDRRIAAGFKWRDEIDKALARAHIAILLVSPDFLASNFIAENELPPLLEAAEKRGAKILSVIVSPCRFEETPELSRYQSVNRPSEQLKALSEAEQDKVLLDVANTVEKLAGTVCTVGPRRVVYPLASPFLPAAPPCFGRDEQIRELIDVVLSDEPAPVCVLGGPGIGKSTLTLKVLNDSRVLERYGDRRWFVRCEAAFSRADLASSIARDAHLPTDADIEEVVLGALEQSPTLLVLDNLETPWEADTLAVEEFLGVLARCCHAALVVSLRGEERPFGIPWRDPMRLKPLADDPARQAFLEVASQKFEGDPRLDEICKALDGIPLAINLMAHQAQGEPNLEGPWTRWLEKRTALLTRADGKHRLTNLEVSYEISISGVRMTDAARRLLSALSLFPDGIAWGDIPVISPDHGNEAAATLRKAGLAFDEAGRLRVLTTLREYVGREYPPDTESENRLFSHLADLVLKDADNVGRDGGADAVERLRWEVGNVEAGLPRALAGPDPEKAIRAAVDWGQFVRFTGMGSTRPLEAAAETAQNLGLKEREADCIQSLGHIALTQSDHEKARTLYETAVPLYKQVGSVLGEANCIQRLGDIALRRSDHEQARTLYETAKPLYKQVGAILGEANCVERLGDIAFRRSDHEQARSLYETARPLYQKVGDICGEANCIKALGDIALERADHGQAHILCQNARAFYAKVGSILGEANCIRRFGDIALECLQYELALTFYGNARPLYQQVGDILGEANCILFLGNIALERSDHEQARSLYESAISLYRQVSDTLGEANCIQGLGDIALERAEHNRTRLLYETALGMYQRISEPYSIGWILRRLARIARTDEERDEYVEAARKAWQSIDRPDLVEDLEKEFGKTKESESSVG